MMNGDGTMTGMEGRTKEAGRDVRSGIPRVVEFFLAGFALIVVFPVFVFLAFLVRISSPGPVIFRQTRVGRNGRHFVLLKFRTMAAGAKGSGLTAGGDHRVTPVGRLLRGTKLDELPELWNILVGEMSFVGPRPEVPEYVDLTKDEWKTVLRARPGLTDPVTLRLRNEEALLARVDDPEAFYIEKLQPLKLKGYVRYLETRSALQDVRIILLTIIASLFPRAIPAPTVREIRQSMADSVLEDHSRPAIYWKRIAAKAAQWIVDILILGLSLAVAYLLRFEFRIPDVVSSVLRVQIPLVVLLQVALLSAVGAFRFVWRYTGMTELRAFLRAFVWSGVLLLAARFGFGEGYPELSVPISVIVLDSLIGFSSIVGIRIIRRIHFEAGEQKTWTPYASRGGGRLSRTLVYGAGRAGIAAVKEIMARGGMGVHLVGFIDDDPDVQGAVIQGVRVRGTSEDLGWLVRTLKVDRVVVVEDGRTSEGSARVGDVCERLGVEVDQVSNLLSPMADREVRP